MVRNLVGVAGPWVQGAWEEAQALDLAVLSVRSAVRWGCWVEGSPREALKTVLGAQKSSVSGGGSQHELGFKEQGRVLETSRRRRREDGA